MIERKRSAGLAKLLGVAAVAALLLQPASAQAFFCIQWAQGQCVYWVGKHATMTTFLGVPGGRLINGTATWDQNAFNAANDWNAVGAIQFSVVGGTNFVDPCGGRNGDSHICDNTGPLGDNPIYFASSFCGKDFGDVIELTNNCWNSNNGQMYNAPVFVNANVQWNAYDGVLRFSDGHPIYDIRRVLLHELGHALGLDHPDEHMQTVQAIMNSRISNLDRLQTDDTNGARAVYANVANAASSGGTTGCNMQPSAAIGHVFPVSLACLIVALLRRKSRAVSVSAD